MMMGGKGNANNNPDYKVQWMKRSRETINETG
jgi:hypothetical protein